MKRKISYCRPRSLTQRLTMIPVATAFLSLTFSSMLSLIVSFIVPLLLSVSLTVALVLPYPTPVQASVFTSNARVRIRIEGADRTLATGTAAAYATLRESLEEFAAAEGLTLTFVQSGGESSLTGVDGPPEKGRWMGYINRGGQIVRQDDYLNLPLQNGDEVVVYLGAADETKIVTHFDCERVGDTLRFFVGVVETVWAEQNGDWLPSSTVNPIAHVRIFLGLPGQEPVMIQTNTEGVAEAAVSLFAPDTPIGVVTYYAEGYQTDGLPLIVRTADYYATYGFASSKVVTRAEAVAFLTYVYALESKMVEPLSVAETVFPDDTSTTTTTETVSPDDTSTTTTTTTETVSPDDVSLLTTQPPALPFSDVTDGETPWFDEIIMAAERRWVAGYEDGTFRPNEAADLLQLCVLTARLFPALYDEGPPVDGLPLWAADAAGGLYHAGLLTDIGMAWTKTATPEMMLKLFLNVSGYSVM